MKRAYIITGLVLAISVSAMADEHSGMMGKGMMKGGMMCGEMGKGMMKGGMMGGEMMGGEMMGMDRNSWFHHGVTLTIMHAEELGLTEKQKSQLEDIRVKYTKEIIRQDAEFQIAEMDLDGLLKNDAADLSKIKDAIRKVEGISGQIRFLRIEAFAEVRKVLTDEQRARLKKLMESHPMSSMMGGMEGMEHEHGEEHGHEHEME